MRSHKTRSAVWAQPCPTCNLFDYVIARETDSEWEAVCLRCDLSNDPTADALADLLRLCEPHATVLIQRKGRDEAEGFLCFSRGSDERTRQYTWGATVAEAVAAMLAKRRD